MKLYSDRIIDCGTYCTGVQLPWVLDDIGRGESTTHFVERAGVRLDCSTNNGGETDERWGTRERIGCIL